MSAVGAVGSDEWWRWITGSGKRVSVVALRFAQTAAGWRALDRTTVVGIRASQHGRVAVGSIGGKKGSSSHGLVRLKRFIAVVGGRIVSPVDGRLILQDKHG